MTAPERIFIDPVSGNRAWRELEGDIPYTRADLVPQWVACSERQPTEFGEYLTSSGPRPRGWVAIYAAGGWVCPRDYPVIAWMPLPQPPKDAT